MEFRLTFAGKLYSTGNDSVLSGRDKRANHKHELRMKFHPQLKRLWEETPFLKTGERSGPSALILESSEDTPSYKASYLAKKHTVSNWSFVPLVTKSLNLMCSIDVLFLKPHRPGGIVNQGDIDGRLKTLLDALAIPDANQDYENREQGNGEKPTYTGLPRMHGKNVTRAELIFTMRMPHANTL